MAWRPPPTQPGLFSSPAESLDIVLLRIHFSTPFQGQFLSPSYPSVLPDPPLPAPLIIQEDVAWRERNLSLFPSYYSTNKTTTKNHQIVFLFPSFTFIPPNHRRIVLGILFSDNGNKLCFGKSSVEFSFPDFRIHHRRTRNSWQSSALRKLHLISSHLQIKAIPWQHEKPVFKN